MTPRERILAAYHGETPDVVPFMLDLSHWFYHRHGIPWDLSTSHVEPEQDLIEYHKRMGVGFYIPQLPSFVTARYRDGVTATAQRSEDGTQITWRYETPLGTIERRRLWEPGNYAWGIPEWPMQSERDLEILGYALGDMTFEPHWDRYRAWVDCVGDAGVVYATTGYSGMGHLLNYWMGIEQTMYAAVDWPDLLHDVIDKINASNLRLVDVLAQSPAEVVCMGDNFSGDIQPPHFFEEWSKPYYVEAIRRLHDAGKFVAVHIDGALRGALSMIRDAGADAADAVTPAPGGDLTPQQCRDEAGPDFLLSGGVAPGLWLPDVPIERFTQAVRDWLALKARSPRLIANVGDQVPPGADEGRIALMRDLVEEHGRYA